MSYTTQRIQRVRELSAKATPGPWETGTDRNELSHVVFNTSEVDGLAECVVAEAQSPDRSVNAEFIAESRTLLVQLADDCEALQQQLAQAIAERDAAFKMSRCECGTDEGCANLVKHLGKCDQLSAQLAQVAALPKQWREYQRLNAEVFEPCDYGQCADELDAILKGTQ